MKNLIKSAVVATALVAGVANAGITVTAPTNGASDLILYVTGFSGTTASDFYVFDTGVSLNTVFAKSNVATTDTIDNTKLTYNTAFNVGSGLSSFLSSHSGDTFEWAVQAFDTSGSSAIGTGAYTLGNLRSLFSSANYAPSVQDVANGTLKTNMTGWNKYIADLSSGAAKGWQDPASANAVAATNSFAMNRSTGGNLGQAESLWVQAVNTAGSASAKAAIYQSVATFTLDAQGNLTVNNPTPPSVPVPGAVWLLGSGLLGLVGVSRRRSV